MKLIIPLGEPTVACCNAGCGVNDTPLGMVDHMSLCNWQEVECPSPGCVERMPKILVQAHIEASLRTHIQNAIFRDKLQEYEIADLKECNSELLAVIAAMEAAASCTKPPPVAPRNRNSIREPTVEMDMGSSEVHVSGGSVCCSRADSV